MKRSIEDVELEGQHVLVRVDFNVPFDRNGGIADDTRISATLPTIRYLQEHGASVILCSHLGRPDGKVVESLRLAPIAERLSQLLQQPVQTVDDCIGEEVEKAAQGLKAGDVLLLENLRFHVEEEANDPEFAKALASLAGIYVNDAFGTAHRAHASTVGVTAYLPAVAGFLMQRELEELTKVLEKPERPMAGILGGAKISSKLGVIKNLLSKVDCLLLGGGMASTFLKAQGLAVGDSLVEDDQLDAANDIIAFADVKDVPLLLPTDVVVADDFKADAAHKTVAVSAVPEGWRIMDVGPDTLSTYREALQDCMTVFWNGPLGVAEFPAFAEGSYALAMELAELEARVVIGGGETAALVEQSGLQERFTHVSTGGGASLEFMEGKTLPGVVALQDK